MSKQPSQDTLDRRQRDNLKGLHARIKNAFSLKQIVTWDQLREYCPVPDTSKVGNIDFAELKVFLAGQVTQLEERIAKRHVSLHTTLSTGHEEIRPAVEGSQTTKATQDNFQSVPRTGTTDHQQSNITAIPVLSPPQAQPIVTPTAMDTQEMAGKHPVSVALDAIEEAGEMIKDYGYKRSPKLDPTLQPYWFQKKALVELKRKIVDEQKHGLLLVSSTGTGKNFMSADLIRHLVDMNFHEGKTFSHIPYLYVTRATIVEQSERVFKQRYNLTVEDMEVINIEVLRSKAGRLWVTEKMEVVSGQEEYYWIWKPMINPCVILWDECQALKNDTSTQHKIACAFNDLKTPHKYQVFISATPFTRVCEAKCFAVSTGRDITHLGFPEGTKLSNATWPAYAAAICKNSKPDEYNEAAVDRLMVDLKDYIIHVKGVKPQFNAINKTKLIDFETKEERDAYSDAYNKYVREQNKLLALKVAGSKGAGAGILVEFLKFRMAAEYIRRYHLAKMMYESVQRGNAACCALGFKGSIIGIVKILVNDFNVPRDQICLVWGGGQTQLTKKQEAKKKIKEMSAQFEAMGTSVEEMLKDLDLDAVEDRIIEELDPSLRLGIQTQEDRQIEIDKFQSGKALYCLFTFRAGGVGLSLHHTDELCTDWNRQAPGFPEWEKKCETLIKSGKLKPGKVRHKESGYAYEEDIQFIPTRPREVFLSPTYSAIELVQGLGRGPRLTSLSATRQTLIFYRGTIEEDVYYIVDRKLHCLGKVVRQREDWYDIATVRPQDRTASVQDHINRVPDEDSGESASNIDTGEE